MRFNYFSFLYVYQGFGVIVNRLAHKTKGYISAIIGLIIFSFTLPMSKIALGTPDAPQISFYFLTFGRAVLAGFASLILLFFIRPKIPKPQEFLLIAVGGLGIVYGFPFFSNYALLHTGGVHGSVITGILPLSTALFAAIYHRKYGNIFFWFMVLLGFSLVLLYAYLRSGTISFNDGSLILASLSASFGYVLGSAVSQNIPSEQVICWTLIIFLPINIILSWHYFPQNAQDIDLLSWGGFIYVGLFSMWLGFFFWYRGLAMGGVLITSQFQLIQPFLSVIFSAFILNEALDNYSVIFCFAIIGIIYITKRIKL